MDGLQHIASISGLVAGGLRGGTVTYDDSSPRPFVYDAARFTRDVSVSGSTTWTPDGIDGTFTVRTPAGTTTSATVRGAFTHLGGTVVVTLRHDSRTQTFEIPGY